MNERRPRWTWRMPLPMPWGKPLEHPVGPLRLLELPLAFTQNAFLSPEDFVKRAGERGVNLRKEHLLELHRRRALVPLSCRAAPTEAGDRRSGCGGRRRRLWPVPERDRACRRSSGTWHAHRSRDGAVPALGRRPAAARPRWRPPLSIRVLQPVPASGATAPSGIAS